MNMAVFWAIQPGFFIENLPHSGIVFYLWVGMFGVFVVAQFWAFAADIYTEERGNRLFPMIAIGATSGAAFGSWITEILVKSELFGTIGSRTPKLSRASPRSKIGKQKPVKLSYF